MTTFALIHGGGGSAWDWHALAPLLRRHGHRVMPVELPTENPEAGLWDYADAVAAAVRGHDDVTVVAHSLGGFTAPLVPRLTPVTSLVLVSAMIPRPKESVTEWWTATGHDALDIPGEPEHAFYHDVDPALVAEAGNHVRQQAMPAMRQPWPLDVWPPVDTRFILCRDDRFFPAEWMRTVVRERLGIVPEEIDGGHYLPLARPEALAELLITRP